ncbi:MAG: hypothetical protein IKI57_03200 [Clostridia bacterium]|nr:hypothetical protein [Clostridia bacterium]
MNKKVSLLIISIFLAIILFIISVYIQKKAVNYVPTAECMIANKDIEEYMMLSNEDYKIVNMPIEIIANSKIVSSYDEIDGLYLKDKIYKGQILFADQFDSKENLMIFSGEEGKEKVSVKLRSSENAVSYIVKPGSFINLYATLNSEYTQNGIFKDSEKMTVGEDGLGYTIIKLLSNVRVISTFDENGEEVENSSERAIDTVLLLVTPEESQKLNLIKEIATFNITEI